MQEDYIEEDFLEEENSSNRRPFLIAVGVLVSLFILLGACTTFFLFRNRAAERADQVAVIETRNAETEAANAATAIAATETAAAKPTETTPPTAAPTETPEPNTPTPTNTPVVEEVDEEDALAGVEDGDTTNDNTGESTEDGEDTADSGDGTDTTEDEGDGTKTDDATPTPISALSETGDGTGDALPQTGLDTWGIVVAAFVLVGLLIFARRLRATG